MNEFTILHTRIYNQETGEAVAEFLNTGNTDAKQNAWITWNKDGTFTITFKEGKDSLDDEFARAKEADYAFDAAREAKMMGEYDD